jgi:hypothetical protein
MLIPRIIAKTVTILPYLVRVQQGMFQGVSKHEGLVQFNDVFCTGSGIGPQGGTSANGNILYRIHFV